MINDSEMDGASQRRTGSAKNLVSVLPDLSCLDVLASRTEHVACPSQDHFAAVCTMLLLNNPNL